jgi:broad specificity phosphatase PhoE
VSKIYLARHGETTWNAEGRYQGRLESQLSERGQAQAKALAAAFTTHANAADPVPTRIISSPMLRCQNTAAPLATALGLVIETDERLIEIGHGSWEGLLRDEIIARDGDTYRQWREHPSTVSFPGGESLQDVADRWNAFAADLAKGSENTLVVSHDAVLRIALLEFAGRPLDDLWKVSVENAAFAVIERVDNTLVLREESRTAHLADLRASIAGQAL